MTNLLILSALYFRVFWLFLGVFWSFFGGLACWNSDDKI